MTPGGATRPTLPGLASMSQSASVVWWPPSDEPYSTEVVAAGSRARSRSSSSRRRRRGAGVGVADRVPAPAPAGEASSTRSHTAGMQYIAVGRAARGDVDAGWAVEAVAQVDGAAVVPRLQHVVPAAVVEEREAGQDPAVAVQADREGGAARERPQPAGPVADHHPLGRAGGAAGQVDDVRIAGRRLAPVRPAAG